MGAKGAMGDNLVNRLRTQTNEIDKSVLAAILLLRDEAAIDRMASRFVVEFPGVVADLECAKFYVRAFLSAAAGRKTNN
jgi:hypothetical protein